MCCPQTHTGGGESWRTFFMQTEKRPGLQDGGQSSGGETGTHVSAGHVEGRGSALCQSVPVPASPRCQGFVTWKTVKMTRSARLEVSVRWEGAPFAERSCSAFLCNRD